LRNAYILTRTGVAEKSRLRANFLHRKLVESQALTNEIVRLQSEPDGSAAADI
jgi:hypothetical protein